jgi:response regulator NasT
MINTPQNRKTILLVDDNVTVRSVLADVMRNAGFVVCGEAGDGQEAIDMAAMLKPDLVVLDFVMPRLNGVEAASMLKRQRPELPIILLTLYAHRIGWAVREAASVDAVISKDEGMDNLLNSMYTLLGVEKPVEQGKQPYERPTVTKQLITRAKKEMLLAEEKEHKNEQTEDTKRN